MVYSMFKISEGREYWGVLSLFTLLIIGVFYVVVGFIFQSILSTLLGIIILTVVVRYYNMDKRDIIYTKDES